MGQDPCSHGRQHTMLCIPLFWQAYSALLQLFSSLHWKIKDHRLPLPLLLHHDIQSTLGRSKAMRGRFDHILTFRAISSIAPWWPLSTEREPSWLRLAHSLLLFLQFSESPKSINAQKMYKSYSYWKPNKFQSRVAKYLLNPFHFQESEDNINSAMVDANY